MVHVMDMYGTNFVLQLRHGYFRSCHVEQDVQEHLEANSNLADYVFNVQNSQTEESTLGVMIEVQWSVKLTSP
jgi:hypothetical protein